MVNLTDMHSGRTGYKYKLRSKTAAVTPESRGKAAELKL